MMLKTFLSVCLLWLATAAQAQDYSAYYQNLPTQVAKATAPVIPANEVKLTDFGAVGDGQTLCTEAFRKAISELTKQGGGTVQIPAGVWLTGPIMLKDNIRLNLVHGAIIYFSPDKKLYIDGDGKSSRVLPCIRATDRKNIAI
ncbi:MAG: glycoside hydrolase family 28 protein, partial [Bacteroidaceae bacterium]|nr:glycoside hydrolase family 28 protein [Bacteroidaceae bacterium]